MAIQRRTEELNRREREARFKQEENERIRAAEFKAKEEMRKKKMED